MLNKVKLIKKFIKIKIFYIIKNLKILLLYIYIFVSSISYISQIIVVFVMYKKILKFY